MSLVPAAPAKSLSNAMANSDCLPVAGIQLSAVSAGIKTPGRLDLVLMEIDDGAQVAACFTQNAFCAAPVHVARAHMGVTTPRYLLINTGNANAGTGEQGMDDAYRCCELVAQQCGVRTEQVLPFSTGVIGEHLPVAKIEAGLAAAQSGLAPAHWFAAAEGIMTTDTQPKACSRQFELDGTQITVSGIAKGAGMIRPNMATMLGYVATDAAVSKDCLQHMWRDVVEHSFNRVTVDGDTSTNDAALLIATGAGGNPPVDSDSHPHYEALKQAVFEVALQLAQWLVRDGEGASKFVAVQVTQGSDEAECLEVAYTIAHSPLVKTALFASDPNWGRLLMAIGRAQVPEFNVDIVSVSLNGVLIAENGGRAASYTEEQGVAAMSPEDITIEVSLGRGQAQTTVWTSDLSYDYVRINAEYRT
jgi:glutamate N-acetyltransferase/amino-acid N-acetyltransferase